MKYDIDSLFHRPSFITGVSGKVGELVFYMRNGRQCARAHVVPANPRTEGQETRRSLFGAAVRRWQALEDDERGKWNARAAKMPCSGYNLFIRDYMRRTTDAARAFHASRGVAELAEKGNGTETTEAQRHGEKRKDPRHEVEGRPVRARMPSTGLCRGRILQAESPASPAHEARLLPRLRSVHALGVFLFRKRKTRSPRMAPACKDGARSYGTASALSHAEPRRSRRKSLWIIVPRPSGNTIRGNHRFHSTTQARDLLAMMYCHQSSVSLWMPCAVIRHSSAPPRLRVSA